MVDKRMSISNYSNTLRERERLSYFLIARRWTGKKRNLVKKKKNRTQKKPRAETHFIWFCRVINSRKRQVDWIRNFSEFFVLLVFGRTHGSCAFISYFSLGLLIFFFVSCSVHIKYHQCQVSIHMLCCSDAKRWIGSRMSVVFSLFDGISVYFVFFPLRNAQWNPNHLRSVSLWFWSFLRPMEIEKHSSQPIICIFKPKMSAFILQLSVPLQSTTEKTKKKHQTYFEARKRTHSSARRKERRRRKTESRWKRICKRRETKVFANIILLRFTM